MTVTAAGALPAPARFVYILERAGADGSAPETDIATVEELWKSKGITTERFVSGGASGNVKDLRQPE
ncbi:MULTISPECIES: hypothetical protein [unclassified Curtobacterium]|uniref:hypothetical protein n=1 Tax=unclassified Curtobacterium TaxID=257496 RepID=UPI000D921486|nr:MULTISPECIES: hypothetical protein [unclassified Curtobacterium]PYY36400.1 hypothetical protein DEI89_04320 [Curtobacterium sp. MCBD17_030]PZE37166.1 hypothetical protein DEJ31_08605 [Curtobacterium sp. MCPF17_031]PZF15498.1 hypothetical protein DEJ25_01870 [Curtobacterium sp. MCPF17_011]